MVSALLTIHNCVYVPPRDERSRLDGDTFRCSGNMGAVIPDSSLWVPKVRLVGVNAPETGKPGSEMARDSLISWLIRGPFDLLAYTRDKYGRLLGDGQRGPELLSRYMLNLKVVEPMTLAQARELLPSVPHDFQKFIANPGRRP